jgi:hypothetical protein
MRKPGVWAMLRTFFSWWRLWLAGVLDEHATDPPPAFIAVAVKQQGWSAARVANFYEGLLADRNRDLKTYVDRARDVEAQLLEARAQGYWEGFRRARCVPRPDAIDLPPVILGPRTIRGYWQTHGAQVLRTSIRRRREGVEATN